MIDQPTPTQEIWKDKETELQKMHKRTLLALYNAVRHGRKAWAERWERKVIAIESLQTQAHARARAYVARKAYRTAKAAQVVRH